MHNISIKCCSAKFPSLLTFLCKAVNTFVLLTSAFPASLFNLNNSGVGCPSSPTLAKLVSEGGRVLLGELGLTAGSVEGTMEKYSNSSLKTIIGCLLINGFSPGPAG